MGIFKSIIAIAILKKIANVIALKIMSLTFWVYQYYFRRLYSFHLIRDFFLVPVTIKTLLSQTNFSEILVSLSLRKGFKVPSYKMF